MENIIRRIFGCAFRIIFLILFYWFFKTAGIILGIIYLLLFVPGFTFAWILDKVFNPYSRQKPLTEEERVTLNNYMFCLAGYIARGNGRIDEKQISSITQYLNHITMDSLERNRYIAQFNIGKQDDYDPSSTCANWCTITHNDRMSKHRLIEFLVSIIYADGIVADEEYIRIMNVSSKLQVEKYVTERLLSQAKAIFEFRSFFEQKGNTQSKYDEATSNGNSYNRAYVPHNDILNACQVLGVSESTSFPDIKKAYIKLMKKYHPDKLSAQGFSEDTIKFYTEKAQTIQQAYDLLKKYHESKK